MSGLSRLGVLSRVVASAARTRLPIRKSSSANKNMFWWERLENNVHKFDNEAWSYRGFNDKIHGRNVHFMVEASMAVFWWWLLTHFYYQWDILAGHHRRDDPHKYTDAELGIPGDDMD